MKSFEYASPSTLDEATGLLSESWGQTEVLAGGTDLITSMKQNLTAPKRLVSLKNLKQLKGIKSSKGEVTIGAMTTLAELAADKTVAQHFPSLVAAAKGVASMQMMAVGTVGGDLCQRPRCWYFRNGFGVLGKDGDTPLVRDGDNRYHAIFNTDATVLFVSPSSLGPALVALEATMVVAGAKGATRKIPAAEFFQTPKSQNDRETALKPNEILTQIVVSVKGLKNAVYEVRHRHGLDWPYVTAAVAYQVKGGSISDARVVLGHVATTPWQANDAAKVLNGSKPDEPTASKAGSAATNGAKALSKNAYKIQLVRTAVKRAVLIAA